MITRYGMSPDFDMVALETVQNQYLGGDASLACSAETAAQIDRQVVDLVKRQHEKASRLLADHRSKLMRSPSTSTRRRPSPARSSCPSWTSRR